MVTWVMGIRVSGLRLIYTSTINVNTLSTIVKIRVDSLLIPKSKSYIVTTYIAPM